MAFIQPDIVPAMAETIHRQIASARGGHLSEESLFAAIVPPGLSKGKIGETYLGNTLRELVSIDVVRVRDGQVSLSNDEAGTARTTAMSDLVRTNAMRSEIETDLWEKDELGSLSLLGARDLVRGVAWFLSLDPLAGPYSYDKGLRPISSLQQQHTGERPIFNMDRWRPFVRWSRYLGFASEVTLYSGAGRSEQALLPDPTSAVKAALPGCLPVNEWVPISTAIGALSQALPVLDGGTYRRSIHQQGAPESLTDCSPSLTLAFDRLLAEGCIEFEVGAGDAEKTVFAHNRGAFHALRIPRAKQ